MIDNVESEGSVPRRNASKETPPKEKAKGSAPKSGDASGLPPHAPAEIGGREGPEPTRYGDWEVGGRCTDF
ncbi:MAG: DUF1674 domain-containing protein [Inquilinaceae bacterium]